VKPPRNSKQERSEPSPDAFPHLTISPTGTFLTNHTATVRQHAGGDGPELDAVRKNKSGSFVAM
jgi:hypothetical protein